MNAWRFIRGWLPVIELAAVATLRAESTRAQMRTPRPILEQVDELAVIEQATIGDHDPLRPAVIYLQAFLTDPLCRNGATQKDTPQFCDKAFRPLTDSRGVLTPSADTIHRVFLALAQRRDRSTRASMIGGARDLSSPTTGMASQPFPSQAAIIGGLSDFVVNRAKDEITVTFVLDLRERVRDDPALRIILAQTLLETQDLTARNVKQIVPALRVAFRSDLENLPTSLLDPGTLDQIAAVVTRLHPDKAAGINTALVALKAQSQPIRAVAIRLQGLTRGETPLEAVGRLSEIDRAEIANVPIRSALLTAGIIAREYRLSGGSLKRPIADPRSREIALALILRDVIDAAGPADVGPALSWAAAVADSLQTRVVALTTSVDELARALEAARASVAMGGSSGVASGVATLTNAATQVVKAVRPLAAYDVGTAKKWDEAADVLDHVSRLQSALGERHYVAAVAEVSFLLGNRFEQSLPPMQIKLLTLAATVAEAQSSDEVSAAFEAAADPVLSFRAKRTTSDDDKGGMFGLNAYVGLSGGAEHAFAPDATGGTVGYGGLTVPIGPEWSLPVKCGSLSLFVPLIDLGTVASFRFRNDNAVQQTPSMTFAQVIAPGAYVVLGLTQRYPLSVALGAQYVPGLRKAADNRLLNTVRFGGYVGVDVPLFHF